MSAHYPSKKPPETLGVNNLVPPAEITPVYLGFFSVGVRVSQLLLLNDLAESEVTRHRVFVSEDTMIRQAYSFVAAAFERLAQALSLSRELTQRGHEIIAEGSNAWKSCTKEDADNLGNTVLCMGELESLVHDLSASLGAAGIEARHWFELGLMVPEGEGDASLPYEKRVWTWNDAKRVDRQLKLLRLRREAVFPDPIGRNSSGGWMLLPGRFSGWNNIEAGLMKMADTVVPDQSATEGDALQLTVPGIAKYIFGTKIHETRPGSNERLIRKWIQNGRITAKKIKRGLYSIRTSHLEILKNANQ